MLLLARYARSAAITYQFPAAKKISREIEAICATQPASQPASQLASPRSRPNPEIIWHQGKSRDINPRE